MRPNGRARISSRNPQALAICDRCGFRYNLVDLEWQFDWTGPRLMNRRILVCRSCTDEPFDQNRTLILPPDPVPVTNPRPEWYVQDDNPISPPGYDPLRFLNNSPVMSGNIGTLIEGAGLDAPFNGITAKLARLTATLRQSSSQSWIGKNWSAVPGSPVVLPGQIHANTLKYTVASFTATAPTDQSFLFSGAASLEFDGWNGTTWVSLWTGTSAGVKGETITSSALPVASYSMHRFLIVGDTTRAAVASLSMNASTNGILS